MSDFLKVFENNFTLYTDLRQIRFKWLFKIVNWQPVAGPGFAEITNSRVWQTNIYYGVYFNDFIKLNLAHDILKRVIMNVMSGGSWQFRQFHRVCITVKSDEIRSAGQQILIK